MRRLIIYGASGVLSLILVVATMVMVHRLVLAIYGDKIFLKHHDGVWLVTPKKS